MPIKNNQLKDATAGEEQKKIMTRHFPLELIRSENEAPELGCYNTTSDTNMHPTEEQNFIIINSILPHFSENRDTKPWLSCDDLIKID